MKKIFPSKRLKKRYLLFENGNKEEIEKIILDYVGILGWAKATPIFVEDNDSIILAIDRKMIDEIRASFEMSDTEIKIIGVSGTIKGLDKFRKL
jgi:RNase P/RNase MRP subunit POP5